jgi:hypothetical protein
VDPFPPQLGIRTTANFLLPDGSLEVTFIIESVQLGPDGSDLAIVELDQPAPASIPRYPLYAGRDEVGQTAVLVGYGFTGHGSMGVLEPSTPTKRAGLNRFDALGDTVDFGIFPIPGGPRGENVLVTDFDSGLAANNTLKAHHGLESDLGFGDDEVQGAPGDSGGPVFIGNAIAGLLSFGFGIPATDATPLPLDSSWGTLGFNTRVSSFREFLTTATNGQAVFIPEPTTIATIFVGIALLPWSRRRVAPATARLVRAERCLSTSTQPRREGECARPARLGVAVFAAADPPETPLHAASCEGTKGRASTFLFTSIGPPSKFGCCRVRPHALRCR